MVQLHLGPGKAEPAESDGSQPMPPHGVSKATSARARLSISGCGAIPPSPLKLTGQTGPESDVEAPVAREGVPLQPERIECAHGTIGCRRVLPQAHLEQVVPPIHHVRLQRNGVLQGRARTSAAVYPRSGPSCTR